MGWQEEKETSQVFNFDCCGAIFISDAVGEFASSMNMTSTATLTTTTTTATARMDSSQSSRSYGYHASQSQQQHAQGEGGGRKMTSSFAAYSRYNSEHLRQLTEPPPTSMVLAASLQLLTGPLVPPFRVYLMTQQYLQNWLNWAFHQPCSPISTNPNYDNNGRTPLSEQQRLAEVIRLAAVRHNLACPTHDTQYTDPGPMNANDLSLQGHPLLLRPDAAVLVQPAPLPDANKVNGGNGINADGSDLMTPAALRRARSLPNARGYLHAAQSGANGEEPSEFRCCAVPESFYETLRSVHGVLCEDGFTVSYQPVETGLGNLIHHHQNGYPVNPVTGSQPAARPVEFRRKIILQPTALGPTSEPKDLMEKLLQEEEKRQAMELVPTVEVHPIKICYSVVSSENVEPPMSPSGMESHDGFVLVSQDEPAIETLQSLMKVSAPQKASSCVRIWSQHELIDHNRYEAVHLEDLEVPEPSGDAATAAAISVDLRKRPITVGEWLSTHAEDASRTQLKVLVETRRTTNAAWPRAALEFENRIKVGDFVDAQDSSGKWYESVVREITEDTVTVHYIGWSSRWDATLKRRRHGKGVAGIMQRLQEPAPLWTKVSRWRQRIRVGDTVEIRDSSSLASRPRWYRGEIKKVGMVNDPIRELPCGAQLEEYEIPGSEKGPLFLLKERQQVLVEVAEERARRALPPNGGVKENGVDPKDPVLRWVDLYGEEICELGTHLKKTSAPIGHPATLNYDFDPRRKPVEIMKNSNNQHGAGFVRESLRGVPPAPGSVGLHNLGNSCFLNSIVQCLNHVSPLTEYFLKDEYIKDLNTKNPLGSGGHVAAAYASLQKKMWGGDYSVLVPRMLKQTVANFAPQFDNSYQVSMKPCVHTSTVSKLSASSQCSCIKQTA